MSSRRLAWSAPSCLPCGEWWPRSRSKSGYMASSSTRAAFEAYCFPRYLRREGGTVRRFWRICVTRRGGGVCLGRVRRSLRLHDLRLRGGNMNDWLMWGLPVIQFLQSLGDWLVKPMEFFSFLGREEFFLLVLPLLLWCVDVGLGVRAGVILL